MLDTLLMFAVVLGPSILLLLLGIWLTNLE